MSEIKQKWIRFTDLLEKKLPNFYATLLPAIDQLEIDRVEQLYLSHQLPFPTELKDIFSINGGCEAINYSGCLSEYDLYSFKMLFSEDPFNNGPWPKSDIVYSTDFESIPPGHVKPMDWNKLWIPFARHGSGDSFLKYAS